MHSRGFTLIEALASITIIAVVGSSASMIMSTATDSYIDVSVQGDLHTELTTALTRLQLEVSEIRRDAKSTGPDIDRVTSRAIVWKTSDGTSRRLRWRRGRLTLQDGSGAEVTLLADVSAFEVETFDEQNRRLPGSLQGKNCDAIRRVSLLITLTRHGVSETLRTRVFIRSMRELPKL